MSLQDNLLPPTVPPTTTQLAPAPLPLAPPARASQDATSTHRVLPTLPPEIIQHIIQLALPPLSITTYRERYDILLRFSLVDSTWHSFAETELYQHILLLDDEQASTFKEALLKPRSSKYQSRTLQLSEDFDWDGIDLILDLAGHLEHLVELWITSAGQLPPVDLDAVSRVAPSTSTVATIANQGSC